MLCFVLEKVQRITKLRMFKKNKRLFYKKKKKKDSRILKFNKNKRNVGFHNQILNLPLHCGNFLNNRILEDSEKNRDFSLLDQQLSILR